MSRARTFGLLILLGLVLSAGAGRAQSPALDLLPTVTGLAFPVAVTHAGDGSGRLFINEQAGRIRIFDGSQLLATPFLDITSVVGCCGERGLLSVAFHPQYTSNGYFYVMYWDQLGTSMRVARYAVSIDPDVADPGSATIVLEIPQPFFNHNGGQLHFGPDGYLYIGTGDGGGTGDPDGRSQDLSDLLGKLLRIDVDGALPYTIPATNPFVGSPGVREEIWALGLRNPWRFSFDRSTGDLFIGDVGQGSREEVDFQPAASTGGENYGWRLMEGSLCFDPPTGCNPGGLTLPILEYDHSLGCSVTGGYRYRGAGIPGLAGFYIYGDYCSGRIWGATENAGVWTASQLLGSSLSISSFGEDEAGELYVADLAGTVYRLGLAACSDGIDNDGDGETDHPADLGCSSPAGSLEDPQCQDGVHNDGDGLLDFDGGLSVLGMGHPDLTAPDPQCTVSWKNREKGGFCGLGFELAPLLLLLAWPVTRTRRCRRRTTPQA